MYFIGEVGFTGRVKWKLWVRPSPVSWVKCCSFSDHGVRLKSPPSDQMDPRRIDADKTRGGNQKFVFIKGHSFHRKVGEFRVVHDGVNDLTIVRGDVNGDGKADFEIALLGQHALHASDFEL